jgi:hypothetical protein
MFRAVTFLCGNNGEVKAGIIPVSICIFNYLHIKKLESKIW